EAVLINRNQAESVTRFSVNERRSLSTEGVLTIACVVDQNWNLLQPPSMEGAALGFARSLDWERAREDLLRAIEETVAKQREQRESGEQIDINGLRAAVREISSKTVRSKLQSKPTIHVVIHEVGGVKVEM